MKHLYVIGTALALAACSQRTETTTEATPATTATPMAGTASSAATQPATGNMAGRYEITMADGRVMTQTVNSDGTYVDSMGGQETRGRWRMDGARACFDPDGAGAEKCYTTTAPGADGSFTATGPDGARETVRKVGAAPSE